MDHAMHKRSLNQDGLSTLDQWKLEQPGFMQDKNRGGFQSLFHVLRKQKEIMWDGTMNQPVLPMNKKLHKNNYSY